MEIHSSSLTYIPAQQKATKHTNDSAVSNTKQNPTNKNNAITTIVEINNYNNNKQIAQIPDTLETQTKNIPQNSRIARALNAYVDENNSQVNNQKSNLHTIIDDFV